MKDKSKLTQWLVWAIACALVMFLGYLLLSAAGG